MKIPEFQEVAGVADAIGEESGRNTAVRIVARESAVGLFAMNSGVSLLTPAQARFLAQKLYRMARIVEARLAK